MAVSEYLAHFAQEIIVLPYSGDSYVVEDSVYDLTWDVIAWLALPAPQWRIGRIRYEWEHLIIGSHGHDMFLELTYYGTGDFPCRAFADHTLLNWYIYFVDFVELHYTKVIIRMAKKEDVKCPT